jgi:HK97 family phage portal protein
MADDKELMPVEDSGGGVISRLSAAYRALLPGDPLKSTNPLQVYEPLVRDEAELKALAEKHPRSSYGASVPTYSSWAEWDRSLGWGVDNNSIDYARRIGEPTSSSLIMAGVRWLGNTAPEAPLMVKETTGNQGESEEVAGHDLVELWRRPNPFYSGSTLMKCIGFSWMVNANAYVIKIRDGFKRVAELWWEPHWTIRPRWFNDGRGAWIGPLKGKRDDPDALISYYEMDRGPHKNRVEVEDVIHLRDGWVDPSTRCGTNGLSSIFREIFGDNEAAAFFANLVDTGGMPKFILSLDKDVQADQAKRDEIAERTHRQTTGKNRNKVLVLSGVTPHKMSWSPEELDLRASRYMSEERFCAVTGIPAVVLELGSGQEHSIYNNVAQASERAVESYLVPFWGHIGEELTVQLLPDFETRERGTVKAVQSVKGFIQTREAVAVKARSGRMRYVEHDLSRVRALQEDEDAKHRRVGMDYRNGIIDRFEARSALNYKPTDEDALVFFPNTGQKQGERPPQFTEGELVPPTKSLPAGQPSDEEVSEIEEWFDRVAPEGVAGILSATVTGNGNGKQA